LHFLYHYSLSAAIAFPSNFSRPLPSTASIFFYLFCPPRLSSPTPPCSDSQNRALEVLWGGVINDGLRRTRQIKIMSSCNLRSLSVCTRENLGKSATICSICYRYLRREWNRGS
jgi:hypothetical protein